MRTSTSRACCPSRSAAVRGSLPPLPTKWTKRGGFLGTRLLANKASALGSRRSPPPPGNPLAAPGAGSGLPPGILPTGPTAPDHPDGRTTIRMTVSVDIWSWAEANGVTVEEAQQVVSERATAGSKAVMAVFLRTLGDFQPSSMQIETA